MVEPARSDKELIQYLRNAKYHLHHGDWSTIASGTGISTQLLTKWNDDYLAGRPVHLKGEFRKKVSRYLNRLDDKSVVIPAPEDNINPVPTVRTLVTRQDGASPDVRDLVKRARARRILLGLRPEDLAAAAKCPVRHLDNQHLDMYELPQAVVDNLEQFMRDTDREARATRPAPARQTQPRLPHALGELVKATLDRQNALGLTDWAMANQFGLRPYRLRDEDLASNATTQQAMARFLSQTEEEYRNMLNGKTTAVAEKPRTMPTTHHKGGTAYEKFAAKRDAYHLETTVPIAEAMPYIKQLREMGWTSTSATKEFGYRVGKLLAPSAQKNRVKKDAIPALKAAVAFGPPSESKPAARTVMQEVPTPPPAPTVVEPERFSFNWGTAPQLQLARRAFTPQAFVAAVDSALQARGWSEEQAALLGGFHGKALEFMRQGGRCTTPVLCRIGEVTGVDFRKFILGPGDRYNTTGRVIREVEDAETYADLPEPREVKGEDMPMPVDARLDLEPHAFRGNDWRPMEPVIEPAKPPVWQARPDYAPVWLVMVLVFLVGVLGTIVVLGALHR